MNWWWLLLILLYGGLALITAFILDDYLEWEDQAWVFGAVFWPLTWIRGIYRSFSRGKVSNAARSWFHAGKR